MKPVAGLVLGSRYRLVRLIAVGGSVHRKTLALQARSQRFAQRRLVFNQQDSHRKTPLQRSGRDLEYADAAIGHATRGDTFIVVDRQQDVHLRQDE